MLDFRVNLYPFSAPGKDALGFVCAVVDKTYIGLLRQDAAIICAEFNDHISVEGYDRIVALLATSQHHDNFVTIHETENSLAKDAPVTDTTHEMIMSMVRSLVQQRRRFRFSCV